MFLSIYKQHIHSGLLHLNDMQKELHKNDQAQQAVLLKAISEWAKLAQDDLIIRIQEVSAAEISGIRMFAD